jgi:hypothetical protein
VLTWIQSIRRLVAFILLHLRHVGVWGLVKVETTKSESDPDQAHFTSHLYGVA